MLVASTAKQGRLERDPSRVWRSFARLGQHHSWLGLTASRSLSAAGAADVSPLTLRSVLAVASPDTCLALNATLFSAQIDTADNAASATTAPVIDLVASDNRTCARLRDGSWSCWGEALLGAGHAQCGSDRAPAACDPTPTPTYPSSFRYLVPKTSGCGVEQNGTVDCWGAWAGNTARPVAIAAPHGARVLAMSDNRLCIGASDGRVACRKREGAWKSLPYDDVVRLSVSDTQVGLVRHAHVLTLWNGDKGRDIDLLTRTVDFGPSKAYVVTRDWRAFAIEDKGSPQALSGLGKVVHIAAEPATQHVCTSVDGGVVRCSGPNVAGQLGTGDTDARQVFEEVPGISGSQRVAVGALHSCALTVRGEVYCWGANNVGQLGVKLAPADATPARRGRQKATISRIVEGAPHGSVCQVPHDISPTPIPCALTPVRVQLP